MKYLVLVISTLLLFIGRNACAQNNKVKLKANLSIETNELHIQQEIVFYNKTQTVLDTIYFHNWPNSFKDNGTPLAIRMIENYNKELYFAKDRHRGFSTIKNISVNYDNVGWNIEKGKDDLVALILNDKLEPNDSVIINATYVVKIPLDKFTRYGRNKVAYNLRYWYLTPAFYDDGWKLMHNLDMDDLLVDFTDYEMSITVPSSYYLNSDLHESIEQNDTSKTYLLKGTNRQDIELSISPLNTFETFNSDKILVETNIPSKKLDPKVKGEILNRELAFIENTLGEYPNKKLFISNITYTKNPVYGLNQLPEFLRPFQDVFEWDIKMFKALTQKYLENSMLVNKREDYWVLDGLQNFLMMKYVEKFYPEVKATGNISKVWGFKKFNLAKLDFNDKYPFVYQFAARKNIDQALTVRADSLSNFNRKIVNKYKAGLGFRYLDEYVGDNYIPEKMKEYYNLNILKYAKTNEFEQLVTANSTKDLSWFFGDYINSSKKIDYTIKDLNVTNDSIEVTIKNKRNITAPVALYGVQGKEIHYKEWFSNIDSISTVTIPKNGFDRLSLNYEYLYPELNLRDNWKRTKKKIIQRPIKVRFFKDIEDPYYNEIYYVPNLKYNYYDGLQLGISLSNKSILRKNFIYKVSPYYGLKDKSFTGSYSFNYQVLPENSQIYKYQFGFGGSYFHYAEDLAYRSVSPYAVFSFNRKSLRDVGGSAIIVSYNDVNKDVDPNNPNPADLESYNYGVFNISYTYSKPEIIQDFRYAASLEVSESFSKLWFDMRYRKLTDSDRQFDFRLYLGTFLTNNTTSDYFSYGLTRQSDYLFRLNYFGRSEEDGFFSQQYITNEGGFKSDLEQNYANQWIASFNSSIGIWRWIEIYNDIGFIKSTNQPVFFGYENGVRLNFIHEFLELYFPVYSNNGWEIAQPSYSSKIRFVLTVNPQKIINFVRRGFF